MKTVSLKHRLLGMRYGMGSRLFSRLMLNAITKPEVGATNFGKTVNYASYLAQSGVPETKPTIHKQQNMNIIKNIVSAGKKIVKNFTEINAEKKEKFVNASQQAFFLDRRNAALKNLMDPKCKLSGVARRRLLEQTGRPIDPSEGASGVTPGEAANKWFNRMMKLPMRSLHRWSIRAQHRVTGLQRKYDKLTTQRNRNQFKPNLDRAIMVNAVVKEVLLFRVANVRPMPVRPSHSTPIANA
jgi:hypothetical protein